MDAEQIRNYCLEKNAVTESFPFGEDPLVFKVGGKMFLLLSLIAQPIVFSAKADPDWSGELRESYSQITGAYHMNKTHWNSVSCDGLSRELILKLIDHSYELIFQSLPKKLQAELRPNQ